MKPFRYLLDPLFAIGLLAFSLNQFLFKPAFVAPILHHHFNDFWLIPCALPPLLWLHHRLGLRDTASPPSALEISGHLFVWCLLFEWAGPRLMPQATGDWRDVIAYCLGGMLAWFWWNREHSRLRRFAA